MPCERSSTILLLAIISLIVLLVLGSIWWVHRTNEAPKVPLHSSQANPWVQLPQADAAFPNLL